MKTKKILWFVTSVAIILSVMAFALGADIPQEDITENIVTEIQVSAEETDELVQPVAEAEVKEPILGDVVDAEAIAPVVKEDPIAVRSDASKLTIAILFSDEEFELVDTQLRARIKVIEDKLRDLTLNHYNDPDYEEKRDALRKEGDVLVKQMIEDSEKRQKIRDNMEQLRKTVELFRSKGYSDEDLSFFESNGRICVAAMHNPGNMHLLGDKAPYITELAEKMKALEKWGLEGEELLEAKKRAIEETQKKLAALNDE